MNTINFGLFAIQTPLKFYFLYSNLLLRLKNMKEKYMGLLPYEYVYIDKLNILVALVKS